MLTDLYAPKRIWRSWPAARDEMTPVQFRLVKHLTATLFAVAMVGLFLLGVDGLIGAMQKLSRVFTSAPRPAPVELPAPEGVATHGVVPAFVVPAEDTAPEPATSRDRE
jgi:hypothetical protein